MYIYHPAKWHMILLHKVSANHPIVRTGTLQDVHQITYFKEIIYLYNYTFHGIPPESPFRSHSHPRLEL